MYELSQRSKGLLWTSERCKMYEYRFLYFFLYRLLNFSTLPAVSTNIFLPV